MPVAPTSKGWASPSTETCRCWPTANVPVFWAGGVTPQAVVAAAGIPYAVSHAPGQMFISDVPESTWSLA